MHKSTNPLTHIITLSAVLKTLLQGKRPMLSESKARNSRTNRRRNLHFGLCYYWLLMYKITAYL